MAPFADASILLTGADGGLGRLFVEAFLARGAREVHACGMRAEGVAALRERHGPRVIPQVLDITDAVAVQSLIASLNRLTLLVNCAGVELKRPLTDPAGPRNAQVEMAVNFLGTVHTCHAALPRLQQAGTGQIVNILSIAALATIVPLGAYGASKAAAHQATVALRAELAGTAVTVHGVYPGWIATGMGQDVNVPKADPQAVITAICDGLAAGDTWIFPDPMSRALAQEHPSWLNPVVLTGLHA